MAGVLNFALGLETSNFLRGLNISSQSILSFSAAMKGISTVASKTWGAINEGAQLADLQARTGAAAGSLYQLQEAFKLVGVSSEAVPGMLKKLQVALGGVDEAGNKTEDAFAALGLRVEDLKGMDPAKQLQAVTSALGNMGQERGMFVASKLFGREGASDAMQIGRQSADFGESMAETSRTGNLINKNVAAFDHIADTMQKVNTMMRGMWFELAANVAPVIQTVMDRLMGVFQEGGFASMLGESFRMAFDLAVNLAPATFAKIGAILLKTFETPLTYLQAGMEFVIQKMMEAIANNPLFEFAMGVSGQLLKGLTGFQKGFKAEDFSTILENTKETGVRFNLGFGEVGIGEMMSSADSAWSEAMEKFFSKYGGKVAESMVAAGRQAASSEPENKALSSASSKNGPQVTSLEKIGFILAGTNSRSDEKRFLQETARNTAETARAMRILMKGKAEAAMFALTSAL